jgi:hypothetical protein
MGNDSETWAFSWPVTTRCVAGIIIPFDRSVSPLSSNSEAGRRCDQVVSIVSVQTQRLQSSRAWRVGTSGLQFTIDGKVSDAPDAIL